MTNAAIGRRGSGAQRCVAGVANTTGGGGFGAELRIGVDARVIPSSRGHSFATCQQESAQCMSTKCMLHVKGVLPRRKYLVAAWLARPLLLLILAAHELKVALEEGTVHCSLVRRLVDLGEVGLAGRVALEAVPVRALAATHANIAMLAAEGKVGGAEALGKG